MAGGSFYRDPDNPGGASAQANALFGLAAQMRSYQQRSSGFQDALATTASGAGNSLTQVMQPIGDSLNMTARQLERLTTMLQRSPLVAGTGAGGQFGGLQMMGAAAGFNVGMQGMSAQSAQVLAPLVMRQNAEIAAANLARSTLTQTLPQLMAAGAAVLPGGFITAPLISVGGQIAMPGALRALGMDAALARPGQARMLQQMVGDQFGGTGTVGRYQASRRAGQVLSMYAQDFIEEEQKLYGGGFLAMNADEYRPLLAAAAQMQSPGELRRMASDGGKRLREQMATLVSVSADLNMTFEEVAQLGMQFGQGPDSIRQLRAMVDQVNRAAEGGGITSRAGLMQFGAALRERAFLTGQDGGVTAGGAISLVREIARGAVDNVYARGQLEAFGGATIQERAQNMSLAVQSLNQQVADSGFGRMLRANIVGGGTGMRGGLLTSLAAAGAQAVNDPWGLVLSETDPMTNARVTQGAAFRLIDTLSTQAAQMFGDPRAGAAAAVRRLQRMGMTGVQAGTLIRFHQENRREFAQLAGSRTGGGGALMEAAAAYAARTGSNVQDVLAAMREGRVSVDDVMSGQVTLGVGGFSDMSAAVDEAQIKRAGDAAAGRVYAETQSEGSTVWGRLSSWVANAYGMGETGAAAAEARKKAIAEERARQQQLAQGGWATDDVSAYLSQNAGFLSAAGVDISSYAGLQASLKGANAARLGLSANMAALLGDYGNAGALGAIVAGGTDSKDFSTVLRSINAALRASGLDKKLADDPAYAGILGDGTIDARELSGNTAQVAALMQRLSKSSGLSTLFANAVTEKANMRNTLDTLVGVIKDGAMTVRNVNEGQKK